MKRSVMIIGGGASGLVASIAAARQGAKVTILEHMDRVGKKLLSTGNGRCNMTNMVMGNGCYRCTQEGFPMEVIGRFPVSDTLAFFHDLGVITKNKNGYIYPHPGQASAVLDCLRLEAACLGVQVVTGCGIRSLRGARGAFTAVADGESYHSDTLVLAAGSQAAPSTGSDGSGYTLARSFGHSLIPPLPALVQLRCAGNYFKQLAGVRCEARVSLASEGERLADDLGELQFTDYGISGIPVFQVSRYAAVALAKKKKVTAVLDFMPSKTYGEVVRLVKQRQERLGGRPAGEFLTGAVHKKLAAVFYKMLGISTQRTVAEEGKDAFVRLPGLIKEFAIEVTATNSFAQAQVCCGGIDTREVDPVSLESKLVPGMYFAGEILDVDGICGGYNLQWAWSTGMVAGTCAGKPRGAKPL